MLSPPGWSWTGNAGEGLSGEKGVVKQSQISPCILQPGLMGTDGVLGWGGKGVLGAAVSEAAMRGEGKRVLGLFSFSWSY